MNVTVPEWLSDSESWCAYLASVRRRPTWQAYPEEFFMRLSGISKRARFVAWSIFEEGAVSTQVLQANGYDHPPRARRDLADHGVRVLSTKGRNPATGRVMAIYSFAPASEALAAEQTGRVALPRELMAGVIAAADYQCALCSGRFGAGYLQVDHRVPFAIAGDDSGACPEPSRFMAVCRSCNRAKSWTCEHCPNWRVQDAAVCETCYWAAPESYEHIATEPVRRLGLVWNGPETADYDVLHALAARVSQPLPDYVKAVLTAHVRNALP